MDRLKGKVAVITGAGSGLGAEAAKMFASEGCAVVVNDANPEAGSAVVAGIRASGGKAEFIKADVRSTAEVEQLFAKAKAAFGLVNVLYNNAGGENQKDSTVTGVTYEHFWKTIKLDLFGTFLCCRMAIPAMKEAGGGSIVNTTSMTALMGRPNRTAYTAAKGGILSMTRSMAVEYADDKIRVNAIAPTRTLTERVKQKNLDNPERAAYGNSLLFGAAEPVDIAYAAVYLASDESRVVSGQTLVIHSDYRRGA